MSAFDLGVGAVLLPGLVPELDRLRGLLTVLELHPHACWMETGDVRASPRIPPELLGLPARESRPILAHGVCCPVGGSGGPSAAMADLLAETVRRLGACMVSEHLAFDETLLRGDLVVPPFPLPPRQTVAGVAAAVAGIRRLTAGLDVPFLVETPVNYLRPRADELSDGRYVAAVARQADCGILLDLHNVWANERNGRQRVYEFLAELPLERVLEVHLAGGFEWRGRWLDAHSRGLDTRLVDLAARVLPMLPNARAVVFEMGPEFLTRLGVDGLRRELITIHRLIERVNGPSLSLAPASHRRVEPVADDEDGDTLVEWERSLAALVVGADVDGADALCAELAEDPGVELLRELAGAGRSGRIAHGLPVTTRLLLLALPRTRLDALLAAYGGSTVAGRSGEVEARQFAEWLGRQALGVPWVADTLAIDLAAMDRGSGGSAQEVGLRVHPLRLLEALRRGEVPSALESGSFVLAIT